MAEKPQSAASHAKMVPMYHYVTFGLLLASLIYFAFKVFTDFSVERVMFLLFVMAMVLSTLFGRIFALGVQDRVIRLEERLRMARVLPPDLHDRIDTISTELLIGLRFASDEELEGLVRRALDGEFADRKAVKLAVQNWRADHQRI